MAINLEKKLYLQIPEMGERESQFLSTTGFFPNFFGKYRSCSATADMTYYLTSWTAQVGPGNVYRLGSSGICAPSECSATDIEQFLTN
jgi:peptidoglycan/LPS O-acetylase OafA/YrhL